MGLKRDDVACEDEASNCGSSSFFLLLIDDKTLVLFSNGGESDTRRELDGCRDENELVFALVISKYCRFRVLFDCVLGLSD